MIIVVEYGMYQVSDKDWIKENGTVIISCYESLDELLLQREDEEPKRVTAFLESLRSYQMKTKNLSFEKF